MDRADLAYAGIARQVELLRAREISARELVEIYLERIELLGARLNCFRTVMAELALEEADAAQVRLDGGDPAPLLGVPIAIKDTIDVAGELTTHGTGAVTRPAPADSEAVRRLRRAGAVIIGKTTVPELAIWGHFTESETWGITRNPWNLNRSSGGSSGGSAVAVAAGLASAALGSDGGASIRVPAAMCGLFGLKPQRGRISFMPYLENWHGLTQIGPLTRSVLDSALFFDAVMGPADGDPSPPPPPAGPFVEVARSEPRTLRIGVATKPVLQPVQLRSDARTAVERTATLLRSLGHEVKPVVPYYPRDLTIGLPRVACGVHDDAVRLDAPERLERRSKTMVRLGRLLHGWPLARARAREIQIAARINAAVFETHDVLLTPLIAASPPLAGRWQGKGFLSTFLGGMPYIAYTAVWNYTGQPAASVPAGFDDQGLPLAVQLVGRPNDEPTLISLAAQIEAARPWTRQRPALLAERSPK